jgi:hypothetical protein
MTLGSFVPRSRVAGDKIDLRNQQFYNRPYLISAVDYNPTFHSKMKNENVEAVWADVLDLQTGSVLINVLFTNGAIVDNLKENVGTGVILPVKIEKQAGGNYGGYAVLAALTDQEAALANQVYNNGGWNNVTQERARREAAARPMGNVQQNQPQGSPFGGQPQDQQGAPFGQAPQGQPFQQNQAPVAQQPFGQPQGQPFQGAQSTGAFQAQGTDPNQAQAAVAQQYQQPQGQPFGQPVQTAPAQQFQGQPQQNQAPAQGFGQPAQGFGQPAQGFGQPVQGDPNAQFPNAAVPGQAPAWGQVPGYDQMQAAQGQAPQGFGQAQPPANDPAAQAALAALNSGQFQ